MQVSQGQNTPVASTTGQGRSNNHVVRAIKGPLALNISSSGGCLLEISVDQASVTAIRNKVGALGKMKSTELASALADLRLPQLTKEVFKAFGLATAEAQRAYFAQQNDPAQKKLECPQRVVQRLIRHLRGKPCRNIPSNATLRVLDSKGAEIACGEQTSLSMLADIRSSFERVSDDYAKSGAPRSGFEVRQAVASLGRKQAALERAITNAANGCPLVLAATEAKVSLKVLLEVFANNPARYFKRLAQDDSGNVQKGGPRSVIDIPRSADPAFAYLMGSLFAAKPLGIQKRRVAITADRAELDSIQAIVSARVPKSQCVIRTETGQTRPVLAVTSAPLARAYNRLSGLGRSLPWAILETHEERTKCLAAILAQRGSWGRAGLEIRSRHAPRRLIEVAMLMRSLGVSPLIELGATTRLIVTDALSLRKLQSLQVLRGESEQELSRRIEKLKGRVSLSAQEYWQVREYRKRNPDATLESVRKATGVAISTFRSWDRMKSDGTMILPAVIKRDRKLLQLKDSFQIGQVETMAHFYRATGCSIGAARAWAIQEYGKVKAVTMLSEVAQPDLLTPQRDSALMRLGAFADEIQQDVTGADEREGRVMAYARELGIQCDDLVSASSGLIEAFLLKWDGFIRAYAAQPRINRRGIEFEEIQSLAAIHAQESLKSFNPARGASFYTYGYQYLERSLNHAVGKLAGYNQSQRLAGRLRASGERLDVQEIQARFGVRRSTALRIVALSGGSDASLDKRFGEDEEASLKQLLSDPNSQQPDVEAAKREQYRRVIGTASEQEREILTMYFWDGLTLAEIGGKLRCSKEAVRLRLKAFYEKARQLFAGDKEEIS